MLCHSLEKTPQANTRGDDKVIDCWIVNAVVGNLGSPETQSNAVYSCCKRCLSASRDHRSAAVDTIVFMTFSCKPDASISILAI